MEKGALIISFKSYIVLDLETTTLPCYGPPKITEISAIAVLREHIDKYCNPQELPRVLNKLTLCVYPQKIIPPDSEKITGLSNMLLEDQSPFNEGVFNILSEFIGRMPKPVCLLAHNGNRFDYPVLQAEVLRLGKAFPNDIWCADSLPAFRFLFSEKQKDSVCQDANSELESMLIDDEEFDSALCKIVDSVELALSQSEQSLLFSGRSAHRNSLETSHTGELMEAVEGVSLLSSPTSSKKMQIINETTPKRPSHPPKKKHITYGTNQTNTPESDSHYLKCKKLRRTGAVKNLVDNFSGINAPKSFKLIDIYQFVCDMEPMNAHNAEADSVMLLQSIVASQDGFLSWVDKNAVLLNSVKKMW